MSVQLFIQYTAIVRPSVTFWLKVSRPGLWFQTVWLFLFPTTVGDMQNVAWWIGLLFVTWPLNLIVYGWNDIVDQQIDRKNPRKDSFLFGARGTSEQLESLYKLIPIVWLVSTLVLVIVDSWLQFVVMGTIVLTLALYNHPRIGLRSRPPFDLLNPLGYLLVIWLSVELNNTPAVPWQAVMYLALFCIHAQLIGEVMDFYPDRESGRMTTCVRIGIVPTKLMIILLVAIEGAMLCLIFRDWLLGISLFGACAGLLVDLTITGSKRYRQREFMLAGIAMNVGGIASMIWVWLNGTLMRVPI